MQCSINEYIHITGYREGKSIAVEKGDSGWNFGCSEARTRV